MGNKSFVKIASPYLLPWSYCRLRSNPDSRSVQDSKQVEETQAGAGDTGGTGEGDAVRTGLLISEAFQGGNC